MFSALIGDGRVGGGGGKIKDGFDGRDGSLLVLNDIALVQHGGERRGGIVQCNLRQRGEAACLAVQCVGDAPSCGREMLCTQNLTEGALAA